MFVRKSNVVFFVMLFSILPIFFASYLFGGGVTKFLILYLLIYIYALAFTSGNGVFVLTSVFISSYIFYLIPYFFWDYSYATRQEYQVHEIAHLSFHYLVAFVVVFLSLFYTSGSKIVDVDHRLGRYENPVIFYICISVLLLFIALSINLKGTALTVSYQEITESRYAFIDYSLVFVLLGYIFSPRPISRKILLCVALLYISISLLYGLRLRSIQMMILIFILYYERSINPKALFFYAFLGVIVMQIWGELRSGDGGFESRDYVIVSNQGGVFLNANMYIGLVRDGLITTSERFTTFLGNILSLGYSQTSLPDSYNLATLASNFFSIPGGGLISGYMYVWGGCAGIAVFTLLISKIYRWIFSDAINQYFMVYGLIVLCTMPRWFAYNPIHFFKMAVWAVILYVIFLVIHQRMLKNGKV